MADEEKKYLINVESNIDEYAKQVLEADEAVNKFIEANKELLATQDETNIEYKKAKAELAVLQKSRQDANKSVQEAVRVQKAEKGSYEELYRAWKNAQVQLKLMPGAYTINEKGVRSLSKAYVDQSKKVADMKKSLDEFGRGVNDNRLNVGNYTDSIKQAVGEMNMMPGALGQAAGGVNRLSAAFKLLIKNPIVLVITAVVGALTALFKAFKSTDRGGTELAARFEQLKAIMDVVRQRVIKFAEAVGHIFKGEWKEAGQAFKETFSSIGDEIREATAAAYEFTKEIDRIEDAQKNFISRSAEIQREIAKLEFTAQDRTKSTDERKKALQEAIRLSEYELSIQKKFAKERFEAEAAYLAGKNGLQKQDVINFVRMTDAEQANSSEALKTFRNNNEEKNKELEELYAAWINLDTQFFTEQKRNIGKLSAVMEEELRDMKAAEKKRFDEYLKPFNEAVNQELKRLTMVKEFRRADLIDEENYRKKQQDLINESVRLSEWETEQYQLHQDMKIQASIDLLNSMSGILGQQTEAGKMFAAAAATIDTIAGATKVYNDPTIPSTALRIAMAAAIMLKGMANVKAIMAVKPGSMQTTSYAGTTIVSAPAAQRIKTQPAGTNVITQQAISQSPVGQAQQEWITAESIKKAIASLPNPIVSVEDINAKTVGKNKVEVRARI